MKSPRIARRHGQSLPRTLLFLSCLSVFLPLLGCEEDAPFPIAMDGGTCGASQYFDGDACRPLTECGGDEFESTAATATADRSCNPLRACSEDEFESTPPTRTADRQCSPLTECSAGEFESTAPTATQDRQCSTISECEDDTFESTAPSATSDRQCSPITVCEEGTYESAPATETSDRQCAALTECALGERETVAPTETSDRECGEAVLAAGLAAACAVDAAGALHCWGDTSSIAPPALSDVHAVSLAGFHGCAIHGSERTMTCWGLLTLDDEPTGVVSMASGDNFTCAVMADKTIACFEPWPSGEGSTEVPAGITEANGITASGGHACTWTNTDVYCWGRNRDGQTDVPRDLGRITETVAGDAHTCVVEDGSLRCWGGNTRGQQDVPAGLTSPNLVAAGSAHMCAATDVLLDCWGDSFTPAWSPPDLRARDITVLALGGLVSCAMTTSGAVYCWGDDDVSMVPDALAPR